MEDKEVLVKMGERIVEAMDAEQAKDVFLSVINGANIYEAILGVRSEKDADQPEGPRVKKPRKPRKPREKKEVPAELPTV